MYTDRRLPNPFDSKNLAEENAPQIIIDALKKYEKIPDRREVVTDEMFEYVNELASSAHPDSKISALKDWFAWSRYSGPRRAEWCQDSKNSFQTVPDGPIGEALAFTIDDIQFFDATGRLLNPDHMSFTRVAYAAVRWRYQKNGDNGEIIKYYKDVANKKWCPCNALWNIYQRAKRLGIPTHEPIAKYRDDSGQVVFITADDVKTTLRAAATEKLGITDPKVLSKWTTHSLRVTAANELHRLGFSDAYIKQRLRWRSDAFLRYLRHTIHVARQHSHAMSFARENLVLRESNLEKINKRRKGMVHFRSPGNADDILWEQNFMAAAA